MRRPSSAQAQALTGTTQLIWPESPFPFFLTREADALAQISNLLPQNFRLLITGAMRLADPDNPAQFRCVQFNLFHRSRRVDCGGLR